MEILLTPKKKTTSEPTFCKWSCKTIYCGFKMKCDYVR